MKNLLIIHGGGPTPVINASLYGAILEAKASPHIEKIYGARYGSGGVLTEDFIDLTNVSEQDTELLLQTPASALGTSRDMLREKEYAKMVEIFEKYNFGYIAFNGGNGSMDSCGKLYKVCNEKGIKIVGIPKTIDNDIAITDHCPGFGSAARYIAATTAEIGVDVKSMPIHVCIIEALGRNAGWITAASALARKKENDAPHLIYLPEYPFDEDEFIADVKKWHEKLGGGVVVVVSEGLKNKAGEPIVEPLMTVGRATYYGDVSAHLTKLVIQKLGIKTRNEKMGLAGRCSIPFQSTVDREEAILCGKAAIQALVEGKTGVMIGLQRENSAEYKVTPICIPIEDVMLHERPILDEYVNEKHNDVTDSFIQWCRPLLGEDLTEFVDFK